MGFDRWRQGPWDLHLARGAGWAVRRALDTMMYLSGWSGRRMQARFRRTRPRSMGASGEPVERRVHVLFWLGLLMLAGLAVLTPFVSLGAITVLVMVLRPVAMLAMLVGVVLCR